MDHDQHSPQHAGALRRPSRATIVWLQVLKPGIVFGNLIAVTGGFVFGSAAHVLDPVKLLAVVLGTSLVVASGCVFNNCIDRDIDRKMARTCHRVLAIRALSVPVALTYAGMLGLLGLALLVSFAGQLASVLALWGWIVYVGFYSLWLKRRSHWGVAVGSISGAMPPAIGYCAASGQIDQKVLLLVVAYCLWQMAHSYAIALFRKDDLRAAGLPQMEPSRAVGQIGGYVALFFACIVLLGARAHMSLAYYLLAAGVSGYWLVLAMQGHGYKNRAPWAGRIFRTSIMVILALNLGLSLG